MKDLVVFLNSTTNANDISKYVESLSKQLLIQIQTLHSNNEVHVHESEDYSSPELYVELANTMFGLLKSYSSTFLSQEVLSLPLKNFDGSHNDILVAYRELIRFVRNISLLSSENKRLCVGEYNNGRVQTSVVGAMTAFLLLDERLHIASAIEERGQIGAAFETLCTSVRRSVWQALTNVFAKIRMQHPAALWHFLWDRHDNALAGILEIGVTASVRDSVLGGFVASSIYNLLHNLTKSADSAEFLDAFLHNNTVVHTFLRLIKSDDSGDEHATVTQSPALDWILHWVQIMIEHGRMDQLIVSASKGFSLSSLDDEARFSASKALLPGDVSVTPVHITSELLTVLLASEAVLNDHGLGSTLANTDHPLFQGFLSDSSIEALETAYFSSIIGLHLVQSIRDAPSDTTASDTSTAVFSADLLEVHQRLCSDTIRVCAKLLAELACLYVRKQGIDLSENSIPPATSATSATPATAEILLPYSEPRVRLMVSTGVWLLAALVGSGTGSGKGGGKGAGPARPVAQPLPPRDEEDVRGDSDARLQGEAAGVQQRLVSAKVTGVGLVPSTLRMDDPSFALQTALANLLAILTHRNQVAVDAAVGAGAVPVLLAYGSINPKAPLLREWSMFCIRNLAERSEEAQGQLKKLAEGSVKTQ